MVPLSYILHTITTTPLVYLFHLITFPGLKAIPNTNDLWSWMCIYVQDDVSVRSTSINTGQTLGPPDKERMKHCFALLL
jgi:hypothetical protein